MKERNSRMGIGAAGAAGIGQGIIGAQSWVLCSVNRKHLRVVFFVIPHGIGWRVGRLG